MSWDLSGSGSGSGIGSGSGSSGRNTIPTLTSPSTLSPSGSPTLSRPNAALSTVPSTTVGSCNGKPDPLPCGSLDEQDCAKIPEFLPNQLGRSLPNTFRKNNSVFCPALCGQCPTAKPSCNGVTDPAACGSSEEKDCAVETVAVVCPALCGSCPTVMATKTPTGPNASPSGSGGIAGFIVGITVFLVVCICFGVFVMRKRARESDSSGGVGRT